MLWNELDKDLIFVNLKIEEKEELLRNLCKTLEQKGYVKETFAEAVLEREQQFPTGVWVGDVGVALPHSVAEHVYTSKIAIAVLERPVFFHQMDAEQTIPVHVIFLLAIAENEKHLLCLEQLVELIQDTDVMKRIIQAKNADEILQIIREKENA